MHEPCMTRVINRYDTFLLSFYASVLVRSMPAARTVELAQDCVSFGGVKSLDAHLTFVPIWEWKIESPELTNQSPELTNAGNRTFENQSSKRYQYTDTRAATTPDNCVGLSKKLQMNLLY